MHPFKKWIKEHGMIAKFIAKQFGIASQTLVLILTGKRQPSYDIMKKIEELTNKEVTIIDCLEFFHEGKKENKINDSEK